MPYALGARKRRQKPTVNERQKMLTLKFNTGRQYTEAGQRIAAALLPTGDIYFSDIDRKNIKIII